VIPPLRFFPALEPPRPFIRAQRALAAAAILARAAADIRRLPARLGAVVAAPLPTKLRSRLSNASIWRRIDKACSKFRVDKSISDSDRVKLSRLQGFPENPIEESSTPTCISEHLKSA
jgi:hypothetical protein